MVDNDSSDHSVSMVTSEFPWARLIENKDNRGFAKAANQGIRGSAGRYILLLNSDTILEKKTLARFARFMEEHPDAGACGARLIMADGHVQPYLFGSDPTLSYLLRRALKRAFLARPLHDWDTEDVMEVDWASGACLMTRSDALAKAGLLDDKMFMYFEDTDLCLRMRRAGWKVYYDPTVTVTHLGGQSSRGDKERRIGILRQPALFLRKTLQSRRPPGTRAPASALPHIPEGSALMHIIIDVRTAKPHFPGIGRYVSNLVRAFSSAEQDAPVSLLGDSSVPDRGCPSRGLNLIPCGLSPFLSGSSGPYPAS